MFDGKTRLLLLVVGVFFSFGVSPNNTQNTRAHAHGNANASQYTLNRIRTNSTICISVSFTSFKMETYANVRQKTHTVQCTMYTHSLSTHAHSHNWIMPTTLSLTRTAHTNHHPLYLTPHVSFASVYFTVYIYGT